MESIPTNGNSLFSVNKAIHDSKFSHSTCIATRRVYSNLPLFNPLYGINTKLSVDKRLTTKKYNFHIKLYRKKSQIPNTSIYNGIFLWFKMIPSQRGQSVVRDLCEPAFCFDIFDIFRYLSFLDPLGGRLPVPVKRVHW